MTVGAAKISEPCNQKRMKTEKKQTTVNWLLFGGFSIHPVSDSGKYYIWQPSSK
jgi:hypothetical protein